MNSDRNGELELPIRGRGLPSLAALRCFEVAAREESFRAAAEVLNLTHSAVSRSVRVLEEHLGVSLFERVGRRVQLTADGRELAAAVAEGFSVIGRACRTIQQRAERPTLTLSCEPTLLMRWLIPQLPEFQAEHPSFDLQLVAASGTPFQGGVDLAIRRNDVGWHGSIESTKLFDERVGPVCRPDLVEKFFITRGDHRTLRAPVTLLNTKTRSDAWQTWSRLSGERIDTAGLRDFEHFYYSLQAAVAGVGVAMGPWCLVSSDIDAGLLTAPMGFIQDGSAYYLLESGGVDTKACDIVRDWVTRTAVKIA